MLYSQLSQHYLETSIIIKCVSVFAGSDKKLAIRQHHHKENIIGLGGGF